MLQKPFFNRRQMLQNLSCGFGSLALADIAHAQQEFLEKKHVGKFVLIPQHDE